MKNLDHLVQTLANSVHNLTCVNGISIQKHKPVLEMEIACDNPHLTDGRKVIGQEILNVLKDTNLEEHFEVKWKFVHKLTIEE